MAGSIISRFAFIKMQPTYDKNLRYLDFAERSDNLGTYCTVYKIPVVYYHVCDSYPTMIICHGNAVDIGRIDVLSIAALFKVNVCAFDYAGYGLHSCEYSSEYDCKKDVEAVYNHLTDKYNVNASNIIIYGRSLGTGVACHLATKIDAMGLILISPLLSAAKVVTDWWIPGDIFENYKIAPQIKCPTLIIHGNRDEVIPYSCGQQLSKLFPNLYMFVTAYGAGHNNIVDDLHDRSVDDFLIYLAHGKI